MHCSSVSTAQGPATSATLPPPTRTSPRGVGIRRTVSSGFGVAADELVGLADGDALDHAGKRFEDAEVDGSVIAGDADGGASGPGDGMRFETEAFDARTQRELVPRWHGTA